MQIYKFIMKNYIERDIRDSVKEAADQYPIVTLTGPRQSGKSTFLRHTFPEYKYVNLENPDIREFAQNDPRGFIASYPDKTIIDEIQRIPELLSYLQPYVDEIDSPGMYLLSGSQNLLLMKSIKQSMAGRTAVFHLLPFSRKELHNANKLPELISTQIFNGFYPRLYDMNIRPTRYYADYVQTYVERDVKNIIRIVDMNKFNRFIKLCAARIGQLMNISSLANDADISVPTAESWLSVLETSFIVYKLKPYHVNYNKRIIKSPKLYFYDTGLACYLLGIKNIEELDLSYMKGALFENIVVNQFVKDSYNRGEDPAIYFWRDSQGVEVDLLVGEGQNMTAYEIKSGKTFHSTFFDGLETWGKLSGIPIEHRRVIYDGDTNLATSSGELLAWSKLF